MQTNGQAELSELDQWNPLEEDFSRKDFNSYTEGIGKDYSRREKETNKVKLFVKGIPLELTEEGLKNLFLEFGEVLEVKKCASKFPDQGITFGFVTYRTIKEALVAIEKLDGFQITQKFKLIVRIAVADEERFKEKQKRKQDEAFLNSLTGNSPSTATTTTAQENGQASVKSEENSAESQPNKPVSRSPVVQSEQSPKAKEEPRTSTPATTPVSNSNGQTVSEENMDYGRAGQGRAGRGVGRGLLSMSSSQPAATVGLMNSFHHADDHVTTTMQPLIEVCDDLKITVSTGGPAERHVQSDRDKKVDVPCFEDENASVVEDEYGRNSRARANLQYPSSYSPGQPQEEYAPNYSQDQSYYSPQMPFPGFRVPHGSFHRHQHRPKYHHSYGSPRHPGFRSPNYQYGRPQFQYPDFRPNFHKPHWGPRASRYGDFPRPPRPQMPMREARSSRSANMPDLNESISSVLSDAGSTSEKTAKKLMPCSHCGKPARSRCTTCRTPYCSRSCQQADWKVHRGVCHQIRENNKEEEEFESKFEISIDDSLVNAYQEAMKQNDSDTSENGSTPVQPKQSGPISVPSRHLILNKPIQGVVSWMDSPCGIWVQPADDEEMILRFQNLNAKLSELYSQGGRPLNSTARKGDYCAAFSKSYSTWNRAQILGGDASTEFSILYIDHGNKETVTPDCLKEIDPNLLELPAQAIHCCLNGFSNPCNGKWPEDSLTQTKAVLPGDKVCGIEAVERREGLYVVNLRDLQSGNTLYNDQLKNAGCPSSPPSGTRTLRSPSPKLTPPPRFMADELPLIGEGLKSGDTIWVHIIEVTTPVHFKAQVYDEKMMKDFHQFCTDLQKLYLNESKQEPYKCTVGELVVAKFASDQTWYRAKVLRSSDEKVQVEYIDYGNVDTVSALDIRMPGEKCKTVPAHALDCGIVGVEPVEGVKWSEGAQSTMKDLGGIQAIFKSKIGKKLILDIFDEALGSLSIYLVSNGWAKFDGNTAPESLKQPARKGNNSGVSQKPPPTTAQPVTDSRPSKKQHLSVKLSPHVATQAICYVLEDDGVIYVQSLAEENMENLRQLTEINERYTSRAAEAFKPSIDELVCAKFDGFWCRGVLREIIPDGTIKVYFVDYGNTDCLTADCIKKLDASFSLEKIPPQAVKCKLEGSKGVIWSQEMISELQSLILQSVTVTLTEEVDDISYVKILAEDKDMNASILRNAQPVRQGRASSNQAAAPTGMPASPTVTSVPSNSVTPVPLTGKKLVPGQPTPSLGQVAESDGCFFIQIATTENAQDLLSINDINTYYPEDQLVSFTPVKGQQVCGNYEGAWSRAVVKDVLQDGQVSLYFMDFGNTGCLPVKCVQPMKPSIPRIPAQAVKCKLEGSKGIICTEEMISKLKELVELKFLTVTLTEEIGDISYVKAISEETDLNSAVLGSVKEIKINSSEIVRPSTGPLPVVKLTPGQATTGFCHVVEEDGTFFIQDLSEGNVQNVQKITELDSLYEGRPHVPFAPVKGQNVCTVYDGSWCRAFIKGVLTDGNVRLYFTDYGNVSCVPAGSIQEMLDSLQNIPAQAIRCKLQGSKGVNWSASMVAHLKEFVLQQGTKVTLVEEVGDVSYVRVKSGVIDVSTAVLGSAPENTKVLSKPPVQNTATPTKSPALTSVKLQQGQLITGCCAHIEADGAFYIQSLSADNTEYLRKIAIEVNEAYQGTSTVTFTPVKNQLVCAMFEGGWYRALVRDVLPDRNFDLHFVDYGNSSPVAANSIQELRPQFRDIPYQAIKCRLAGSDQVTWSPTMTKTLSDLIYEKPDCEVKLVVEQSGTNYVTIHCGGIDINTTVLKQAQQTVITLPSLGSATLQCKEADLILMTIMTPGEFYCVSPKAEDVTNRVHDACSKVEPDPGYNPGFNEVCAAVYALDDRFYRATVVDKDVQSGEYEVKYLDYGNSAVVQQPQLRPLGSNFTQPPCAFLCYIPGVVPGADSCWSPKSIEIIQGCSQQLVHLEVLSVKNERHEIRLFSNGVDIGQMLRETCNGQPAVAAGGDASKHPLQPVKSAAAPVSGEEALRRQNEELMKELEALKTMMALQKLKS